MTRNGAKKSCQPRCVHSWQTERRLLWFKTSKVKIGSMAFIYDTGGHQLTTQSPLDFVSICHLHLLQKVSCRILRSCVFESPQHAAAITQRQNGCIFRIQKSNCIFFSSRKGLLWNYCQQKTFSSDKTYSFILYIFLGFHWSYWGFFNKENLIY